MQAANRDSIEQFVRVTLGCKCPDEVFDSVSIERAGGDAGTTGYVRLTIGDRLLVYVIAARASDVSAETISMLARTGLAERESRGLNRFRLVLSRSGDEALAEGTRRVFAAVAGADDRAHLHMIDAAVLPRGL
jgi:hypothetical protein